MHGFSLPETFSPVACRAVWSHGKFCILSLHKEIQYQYLSTRSVYMNSVDKIQYREICTAEKHGGKMSKKCKDLNYHRNCY